MPNDTSTPGSGYFEITRAQWRLILACTLLAGAVALGFSLAAEKTYEATANLLFRSADGEIADPTRLAGTNEGLVGLGDTQHRTAERLEGFTEDDVDAAVEVEPVGVSNLISITAADSDPETAAELANTYAESFIKSRRAADNGRLRDDRLRLEAQFERLDPELRAGPQGNALQRQIGDIKAQEVQVDNSFEFVSDADVPENPASPRPLANTVLGLVLGLLVGFTIAVGLTRFRESGTTP